jgi:hypothetical protein
MPSMHLRISAPVDLLVACFFVDNNIVLLLYLRSSSFRQPTLVLLCTTTRLKYHHSCGSLLLTWLTAGPPVGTQNYFVIYRQLT